MGCMICLRKCPDGAIEGGKKKIHVIDQEKCTNCGTCFEVCPPRFGAVKKISGEPVPPPIPRKKNHSQEEPKEIMIPTGKVEIHKPGSEEVTVDDKSIVSNYRD